MNLRIILVVALTCIGTSQALECFGHTCGANQYCLVEILQNTGSCVIHHGNSHHEAHQQCIGAHHQGTNCYCLDQSCINIMSHATTTAAHSTTTPAPVTHGLDTTTSSMMPSTTETPTGSSDHTDSHITKHTTTVSVVALNCFGNPLCFSHISACKVHVENSVPKSGACAPKSTTDPLSSCIPLPSTGDCKCETVDCMQEINKLVG